MVFGGSRGLVFDVTTFQACISLSKLHAQLLVSHSDYESYQIGSYFLSRSGNFHEIGHDFK